MARYRLQYDLTKIGMLLDLAGDAIILGHNTTTNEDLVIAMGNFADAADSGYAPGSIGLDTTDGLLFVSDTNGVWQQVTV